MTDYKETLNLPDTTFPMKANLVQHEPEIILWWEENAVYKKMIEASGENGIFILHDGPPYANGHIHLGTALNKILKDIVIKSRNMQGYRSHYVPGWDCHGLPIELKVEQELGKKKQEMPLQLIRTRCREYAEKFLDIQREEFKRLGVFGSWTHPYKTMDPIYESVIILELARFVEKGSVIRSKKPIYWCYSCETALAEAEVEYADHTSSSIFVRFPVLDEKLHTIFPQADLKKTSVVIWTTTPWTLPSNMAVAIHPDFDYALLQHKNEFIIIASELVDECLKQFEWEDAKFIAVVKGKELEGVKARHPFYDQDSVFILGDHVTLEAGTGCVHTAPGHGPEDYEVALKYNLDIYSPLDDQGRYFDTVKFFGGLRVDQANPAVIQKLEEFHRIIKKDSIKHSYPHCWRCKNPVIFRATTQWFISMEKNNLREKTLSVVKKNVEWIPSWGEERIYNMISSRPDWCISRQRIWGVPIVALLCEGCGESWNDPEWMRKIAGIFAAHPTGCDYWYEAKLEEIVPPGLKCLTCGGEQWKRESDILDVWFDSGSSFAAVLEQYPELGFPADLYLEGSDQHRGWFHSSLLISIGTHGVSPYNAVLTHGYVVDGNGRKMSKSMGNVTSPQEISTKFGAEILRLWVSSVDYKEDVRISNEILQRLVDAYRRIRNTCRYLLGNINDLMLGELIPLNEMDSLDQYILSVVALDYIEIQKFYISYNFHNVFHTLHKLCTTDLSAFYLDIVKDRLYTSSVKSHKRKSAQTALFYILQMLLRSMAPILSFTAEEVYKYIPTALKDDAIMTVFMLQSFEASSFLLNDTLRQYWETLLSIRVEVNQAIEPMRKKGKIGHSLDTHVTLYVSPELHTLLLELDTDLCAIFIVSQLDVMPLTEAPVDAVISKIEGLVVVVNKAQGSKCQRCWMYSKDLGSVREYPTICPRCTGVIKNMNV